MPDLSSPMYKMPGFQTWAKEVTPEIIFASPDDLFKKGVTVAAGYPHVAAGDVMGRITATGKYRRLTRAQLNAALIAGNTTAILKSGLTGTIYVPPFVIGEAISVNGEAKTLTAVDELTGQITFTPGMVGAAGVGSLVVLTTPDGSQTAVGVAARPVASGSWDPGSPNIANLLPVDFGIELILGGALRRSVLNGLDTTSVTDLSIKDLNPAFDCVYLR